MHETFEAIRADALARLADAAGNRRSPMHTPVVATADADARVMVLRAFDPDDWTLRFHTDVRAPKVAVIEADPRVGVLAYDKEAKVQLRLRGQGRILREGSAVDEAWEASTRFARRCYLGDGPGAVSQSPTSGLPEAFEGAEPDESDLVPARENFALLRVEVDEIDWFCLAHTGHRRALITREAGQWVSP
ncbi:pyridoxamine 5'-phosphate oxidase family protein [Qipengyuania flava]|uniref:pyridoxamine 5'-phosphate oxidase family protein n=1 Tax=Qipengyuania flava TaxID=192812 RepID=UPI001C62C4B5|nr:pyridoxamine 5'-phosphate oxidase family protein [Qipengyuania flava]QYJ08262.1 pyridoxamine 5'-phosphate oxidase family protein [Qipengyuania flava]